MRLDLSPFTQTTAVILYLILAVPAFAGVTVTEDLADGTNGKEVDMRVDKSKTKWPKRATIDTARTAEKELAFADAPESTGEKSMPGQTFTASKSMTLARLYIRYATLSEGSFFIRIQEVPEGLNGMSFAEGKDLFPTALEVPYKINTNGAARILELELTGEHRISLEAKKVYSIEIVDRGKTPLIWYRAKGDIYPLGYAHQKKVQMTTPSDETRDFTLAIDSE